MTHYVWAAKAEPRHRDRWREPFGADELAGFTELADRRVEVTLAVGLTPGAEATSDDLIDKLAPAVHAGAGVVDPHWPGDDPPAAWWHELAAGLPHHAADVGLDDGVQRWIDAAREGAGIAIDALALLERVATRGKDTGSTLRQFALLARWRTWHRLEVLTFGGGPRARPVLGQESNGHFVARAASFEFDESTVDLLVRRALHS